MARSKNDARIKRHKRSRKRVQGSAGRPRLQVFRSLHHIYAAVIDDSNHDVPTILLGFRPRGIGDCLGIGKGKSELRQHDEILDRRAMRRWLRENCASNVLI